MTNSPFVLDTRQAFVDLAGPIYLDDEDPLYPYTPPSIEDSIDELAARPPRSFDSLTRSVPNRPRSLSMSRAISAIARLLASPACANLLTLRVAGGLHLINDKAIQDALSRLNTGTLILQEPQALVDSHALAGTLSACNSITELHLAISPECGSTVHGTFEMETRETLSKVKDLKLRVQGAAVESLASLFATGSLASLESLDIFFDNSTWLEKGASILQRATSSFSCLSSLKITRSASDSRLETVCDGDVLLPILTVPTIRHLSLVSQMPSEGIKLSSATADLLPSDLQALQLLYAAPPDITDFYRKLLERVPSFSQLEKVEMVHWYHEGETHKDEEDTEIMRVAAGHPSAARKDACSALSRLADELELTKVSYRLRLIGQNVLEEHGSLSDRLRDGTL